MRKALTAACTALITAAMTAGLLSAPPAAHADPASTAVRSDTGRGGFIPIVTMRVTADGLSLTGTADCSAGVRCELVFRAWSPSGSPPGNFPLPVGSSAWPSWWAVGADFYLEGRSREYAANGSYTESAPARGLYTRPSGAVNGGVTAASNADTTLARGISVAVPFAMRATATYNRVSSSTVTFTAPADTVFTPNQTVTGRWRPNGSAGWNPDPTLDLRDVTITNGGRTLRGTFASRPGFEQSTNHELGWLPMVTANADAPAGSGTMTTTATGSTNLGAFSVSGTTRTTLPTVANGGLAATGIGFPTTIRSGERARVHLGVGVTGAITAMNGTSITVDAPAGSRFSAGQSTLTGEYRTSASGSWTSSPSLTLIGTVSASGSRFTGTVANTGSGFRLDIGYQSRWGIDVEAGTEIGTENLAFSATGSTNHGAFSFSGDSAVRVSPRDGTIVPAPTDPVELRRGATTGVPFTVENEETRTNMVGTVEVSAPAGTTFSRDQASIAAQYRSGASGSWTAYPKLDLKNGVVSENARTMTFRLDTDGGNMVAGEFYRYVLGVDTPATGPAMSSELAYTYAGDSSVGSYRASGTTKTTAPASVENGGFDADGVGHAVTVEQGERGDVRFGMKTGGTAVSLDGATRVTATAPSGTRFPSDLRVLTGQYKDATGPWVPSTNIDITGTVSSDGTTFTGTIPADAPEATFQPGSEARWTARIDAAIDAAIGTRDLEFGLAGTTTAGSFAVWGTSAVTIEQGESVIRDLVVDSPRSNTTVESPAGGSGQFPNARVPFVGTGQPGATITVIRPNGMTAGSTTVLEDGTWTLDADLNWIHYDRIRVVQAISGLPPTTVNVDAVTIVREGTSRDFAVTNIASNGTLYAPRGDTPEFPNARAPFAGDGAVGATVRVFRENGRLGGRADVGTDGRWSLDANLNWGKWNLRAEMTPIGGMPQVITLEQVTIAPEGVSKGFTVESPRPNSTAFAESGAEGFPNAKLHVTGEGTTGSRITFVRAHNGRVAGTATVGRDGEWALDADVQWGTWSFRATETKVGGVPTPIELPNVTVVRDVIDRPFGVTEPTAGSSVSSERGLPGFPNARVTFRGEGRAGAAIEVVREHVGKAAGTTTVAKDGTWEAHTDWNFGT